MKHTEDLMRNKFFINIKKLHKKYLKTLKNEKTGENNI